MLFNPGWFGEDEDTIYSVKPSDETLVPGIPNTIAIIGFSLDKNVVNHSRAIYNALDFLGDVGGLSDGLKLIAWTLVTLLSPNGLTVNLISKLFYAKP